MTFTKLCCKLELEAIADWVSKSYFPAAECLQICKDMDNLLGQAVLQKRCNRPDRAIDAYLGLIGRIAKDLLLEEIVLVEVSNKPDFLPVMHFDAKESKWVPLAGDTLRKRVNQLNLPQITHFDDYLAKACGILIDIDSLDQEQRVKGWFKILEFLETYKDEATVQQAVEKSENESLSVQLAALQRSKAGKYKKSLTRFIDLRIREILMFRGLDIPLKELMAHLSLSFWQI